MVTQAKSRTDSFQIFLGIGLAVILAILFVVSLTSYLRFLNIEDPYAELNVSFCLFIVTYTLIQYFIIIRAGINYLGRQSLREIGWRTKGLNDFVVGVLGGLIAAFAVYLFGFVLGEWDWSSFCERQLQFSASQRILFLLIGMNAGFIEESLFRGYLQTALVRKYGLAAGIIITSVVFGLYHLKFSATALGGKILLGVIFGLLRNRDSSLVRPAIAHAFMWILIGSM